MSEFLDQDAENIPELGNGPVSWRVVGAAVQGVAHQRSGLPCQDAQGYRRLPGGELIIALADGAGSASRSEYGARRAVEAALDSLEGSLAGKKPQDETDFASLLLTAYDEARQALLALAGEEDEAVRAYATTLSLVVLLDQQMAVGQLGDGVIVGRDAGGELFVASPQQRGEYANETNFLTQDDALDQVDIQIIDEQAQALAVMSDGLTRLALRLPSQEPHAPFFGPLFAFAAGVEEEDLAAEHLSAFLASERICARTDDDKALVLAVRS